MAAYMDRLPTEEQSAEDLWAEVSGKDGRLTIADFARLYD